MYNNNNELLTNDNCDLNVAFSWIDFTTIDS